MAATTSQWWRRLANAYEVKAGMIRLQCKNCVRSMHERFRGELLTMARYTNQAFTIRRGILYWLQIFGLLIVTYLFTLQLAVAESL